MVTGILITNKTYGRDNKGRLLYLCIADADANYLVPFNNPTAKGFHKAPTHFYVVFTPTQDMCNGYYLGRLEDCLGTVDSWEAYSKYELFKRNLYASPVVSLVASPATASQTTASPATNPFKTLEQKVASFAPIYGIQESHSVISIDPAGCTDIDDAFSFYTEGSQAYLQIHIANVPLLLETNHLWDDLTTRVTTVYMPTGKVPMLPKHLSDNICSLLQGTVRPTFMITFVFEYDVKTGAIKKWLETKKPVSTFVYVEKNYTYDDDVPQLNMLFESARILEPAGTVNNTHDLIAVFMMAFNKACAPYAPIYRNCINAQPTTSAWFQYELQAFTASYDVVNRGHATISGEYTHITSPIRRLVDLINMTALLYGTTHPFVLKWIANVDHINYYSKQARKAQQYAELYKTLSTQADTNTMYKGVHIEGTGVVYLTDLRLFVSVGNQIVPTGTHKYNIYMFHKEYTMKRKIRISHVF